ncbi:MAG: ABC transporter ATP-binding protein [Clostridia bacterium]|nr:ABC transporter ATP-binding protein [Clostridia bacterium]
MKKETLTDALKVIGRIVRDTRPIMPSLIFAAVVSLVSIILSMLAPELIGILTDGIYDYVTDGVVMDADRQLRVAVLLIASYLVSDILSVVTMIIMNNTVSRHFTCRIRIDMSAKISKIPIKKVDTTPNGEIISRMTNDVSIMGGSVHDIFNIIINGVLKLIVITVLIFIANPIMAAVILVFVPASIFLSAKLAARSEKFFAQSREAAGKIYSATEEDLTGFDTVKVYNLEKHKQNGYEQLSEDYRKKSERGYLTSGIVQPIVAVVNNLAYIAICVVGSILVINGTLRVGDLMAFILYTQLFSGPLESISGGMSMMQSTIASARRVYDFLDSEEMEEPKADEVNQECIGKVTFDHVAFSYEEDKPLIRDLNLEVLPGQKIAIVGPTGGGKTTIVNLLMRFYDPTSGHILVDGRCIQEMNRSDVREMFSMVLQDTVLFSGTVYDNIAYGNPSATSEEVMEAARRAHIDFWIDGLPEGFNTVINEESTNISGGQKQLLTIARAYLSNRPILILDEATSNVDTRTELIIQETMDELMKGRTAFVIAHRLSTVENSDLILVINNGDVVEKGTHKDLLSLGGLYSEIYNSQYSIAK